MRLQDAIADTVSSLRKERNLTLRQVSAKGNLAYGYLWEVEHGVKCASNDVLESIAEGLNLTTLQLIREIYTYLEENNEQ